MSAFLTIVGGVALVLLSIAAIASAVAYLLHVLEERRRNIRDENYDLAVMRIGKQMSNGAHWYYEGGAEAAALLVKEIGDHMMKWGVYDEDRIRDNWRKARAGEGAQP